MCQEHTPQAQEAESDLQPPAVNLDAVENLNEQGWQLLLNWLEDNAPRKVYRLAYTVNFFDYYQRLAAENEGNVNQDTNDFARNILLDLVNAIGEKGNW